MPEYQRKYLSSLRSGSDLLTPLRQRAKQQIAEIKKYSLESLQRLREPFHHQLSMMGRPVLFVGCIVTLPTQVDMLCTRSHFSPFTFHQAVYYREHIFDQESIKRYFKAPLRFQVAEIADQIYDQLSERFPLI